MSREFLKINEDGLVTEIKPNSGYEINSNESDPFIRCVFEKKDENYNWVPFIEVGQYKLSEISKALWVLIQLSDRK